jgi:hypothetical protein
VASSKRSTCDLTASRTSSFEEELAGGGSGFSFDDLLADRAGTTFALLATQDNAVARWFQTRPDVGFRVDDFFPEAADLPENIPAGELGARYGDVGGRCSGSGPRRWSGGCGVARFIGGSLAPAASN